MRSEVERCPCRRSRGGIFAVPTRGGFGFTRRTIEDMSVILGIAGAARNGAVALCDNGHVVAVCERARLTRSRRAPLRPGQLPLETLETILRMAGRAKVDISTYAVAEPGIELPR